jgi:hypothetical protein
MTVVSPLPTSATTTTSSAEIDRSILLNIFSSIGRCRFLEEKHFDACTALSGSGPAFACIFLEAMADGGVMMGLPRAEALELAAQTLQGAARMTLQGGTHPAQLKDAVTSEWLVSSSYYSRWVAHDNFFSAGRMHDRGSTRPRGRPCPVDDRSGHPDRYRARIRARPAGEKVILILSCTAQRMSCIIFCCNRSIHSGYDVHERRCRHPMTENPIGLRQPIGWCQTSFLLP